MAAVIVAYLIVSFISLLFMLFLMKTAPAGYEDETGFHKIKEGK